MSVSTELDFANIDELQLDPRNPRLGLDASEPLPSQAELLEMMKEFTLEELAVSYLESNGFWPWEAVIVVEEEIYGKTHLVVVEGNRRLAALRLLRQAYDGEWQSRKWRAIVESAEPPEDLFVKVPFFKAADRSDVASFIGFRHVTGIKEWEPREKASFIAGLIDKGNDYRTVMRRIGSKTPTVRQLFIAFKLLKQIEDVVENYDHATADARFSVMYLSLRTTGVRIFLNIDIEADPQHAQKPVPRDFHENLEWYARWLFGTDETKPLLADSRRVDDFGRLLESPQALEYLKSTKNPDFEVAYNYAGGDEPEIARLLTDAAEGLEMSLRRLHLYENSEQIEKALRRLSKGLNQALNAFPEIRTDVFSGR